MSKIEKVFEKVMNINYFKIKLKYNPFNYSFKDRVLVTNEDNLIAQGIFNYTLASDTLEILNHLKNNHFYFNILKNTAKDDSPWDDYSADGYYGTSLFANHLHISYERFFTEYGLAKRDKKAIVDALNKPSKKLETDLNGALAIFYLVENSNSLLKYIALLHHNIKDFSEIENFNKLTENLENAMITGTPTNVNYYKIVPYSSLYGWADTDKRKEIVNNVYDKCFLEFFYILEQCTPEFKKIIYTYLENNYDYTDRLNMFYRFSETGEIEYSDTLLEYLSISDISERFKYLQTYTSSSELCVVNLKLLDLSYYIFESSYRFIKIKQFSNVLDFCKKHKINIMKEMSAILPNLEKLGIPLDTAKEDTESSKTSMLPTPKSEGSPVETETHFKSSVGIDELDKKIADFNDSKYHFNASIIEDDVDDTSAKVLYENITKSVKLLNDNLTRRIKEIKVYNTGGKEAGQTRGKLDKKNLHKYKTSDKIFYTNTYKIKESDLAFGIVLDVSGSMRGENIRNGRITMVVLHETLKALGINHSIITHTNKGPMYQCTIKRYQLFKEDKHYKITKNYKLATIEPEGGNCDSAALYYMEKAMERVRNKDKIVIMFSDGAPTECTGNDLKTQVHNMERKGIKVIGVGINHPKIAEYYSDYANGKNLKQMLDIVSNILKEYVLHKKD